MAIDKTNNLAAFLDDVADGIRVAETGSATPDNNDIPAQSFRSRIETLPARVRPDVARAGTTITVTADDTNNKLTIVAANNQGTGYVAGSNQTASTDVTLTCYTPFVNTATGVVSSSASAITTNGTQVSAAADYSLATKGATTIIPTTSEQTAVNAGVYTTGDIKVAAVPSGSISASGTASATTTVAPGTVTIANKKSSVSGKTQITAAPTTSSSGISTYYMAVNATAGANYTGKTSSISGTATAKVNAPGYVSSNATGSVTGTATAKTSAKSSSTYYIPIATGGAAISGGILSGGSAVTPTVSLSNGSDTNMSNVTVGSKDTTNYPYYFKVNGASTSGSSTVTRAAIKDTHTAGYIPARPATTVIGPDFKTVTVNAGSGSSYVGLKGASLNTTGSVAATATVPPGDLSLVSQVIPVDGKKLVPVEIATSTSDITTPFYTVVRPEVAEGSATISGSGTATASVSSAGYASTDLLQQGSISVGGTATSSAKVGDSHYLSIPAGAVTVMTTPVSVVPTLTCNNGTITANVSQSISVTPYATTDGYVDNSRITTGYLTASGSNSIYDENLISENIKAGVSIFGVTGDYVGTDSGSAKYSAMVLKKSWPVTLGTPIDYGFEYASSLKAMVPQNKGKDGSFALCRVFLTVKETCDVTLEVMNYAEAKYDYGIIGNLGKALSRTASGDSSSTIVKKAFSTAADNKNAIQEVVFSNLSAGNYFFEVKYKKDASTSSNNDTFYFKFKEVPFVVYDDELASAYISDISATSDGDLNIEFSNDNTDFVISYEIRPGEEILPSKILKGQNILGVVGTGRGGGFWSSFGYQIAGMSDLTFSADDYPTRAMKITIPDLTEDHGPTWRFGFEDDDGWHTLNDIRNGTIYVMDTVITAYVFRTTDTGNRPAVYEYDRQWENISIYPSYTLSSAWAKTIDVTYFTYG